MHTTNYKTRLIAVSIILIVSYFAIHEKSIFVFIFLVVLPGYWLFRQYRNDEYEKTIVSVLNRLDGVYAGKHYRGVSSKIVYTLPPDVSTFATHRIISHLCLTDKGSWFKLSFIIRMSDFSISDMDVKPLIEDDAKDLLADDGPKYVSIFGQPEIA
jgi:hypothetical protein